MPADALPLGSRRRVRAVILALAAVAGWLDGLTFVALGSVFVSAVTGDLVQVGIAAADGDGARLLILVAALAAFVAGTSLAVTLVRAVGTMAWPGPVRRPLLVHAGLLIVFAALWTAAGDPERGSAGAVAVVGIAAFSAGVQGAAILGLGIRGATVNAVTSLLMLLGAGLAERSVGVPGPRPALPWWELVLILVIYSISGLMVALAFSGEGRVLAWVPALLALAVLGLVPRRASVPHT
jgi:uncharacterized membrane protein YoaK (UPF0700 family)